MDDNKEFEVLAKAQSNDPRKAKYGCFLGSSGGWDGQLMFWYESIELLKQALMELYPVVYGIEDEELIAYQNGLRTIFDNAQTNQITEEMLVEINENSQKWLNISWFGNFAELTHGDTEFAVEVRNSYRESEDDSIINSEEIEDFIEFLQTFGSP